MTNLDLTVIIKTRKEKTKETKTMTFFGYKVGKKTFGCGQRKEAFAYAKETGLPVEVFQYKF